MSKGNFHSNHCKNAARIPARARGLLILFSLIFAVAQTDAAESKRKTSDVPLEAQGQTATQSSDSPKDADSEAALKSGQKDKLKGLEETRDRNGWTPLMWAVFRNQIEDVEKLLKGGASPASVSVQGESVLTLALKHGSAAVIRLIAERYRARPQSPESSGSSTEWPDGLTPLMVAVASGDMKEVRMQADAWSQQRPSEAEGSGAWVPPSLKDKDSKGRNALHWAAIRGRVDVMEVLLTEGATLDEQTDEGDTAMLLALQSEEADAREVALRLVRKGANPNLGDRDGRTALLIAAGKRDFEMCKLLLDRKAKVDQRSSEGSTPLSRAAEEGDLKIVDLLLAAGAPIQPASEEEDPALLLAAGEGHLEVVRRLVEKGAAIHALYYEGYTPLMWAAQRGRRDVVEFFLTKGADPNQRGGKGMTPLMLAAEKGNLSVVELLLERGADPTLKNREGQTARVLAAKAQQAEVVEALKKTSSKGSKRGSDQAGPGSSGASGDPTRKPQGKDAPGNERSPLEPEHIDAPGGSYAL